MLLIEEVFLALTCHGGYGLLFSHLHAIAFGAFVVYHCFFLALFVDFLLEGFLIFTSYSQDIDAAEERAVEVWLVSLNVTVKAGVYPPLYNAKCLVEERREAVANGVVEVIAKNEGVPRERLFGSEGESYRITVVGMLGRVEVGGCGGGAFRET